MNPNVIRLKYILAPFLIYAVPAKGTANVSLLFNVPLIALFVLPATFAFGQISARDYDVIVRSQRRAIDSQIAWRDSKKISLTKDIPENPKGQSESTSVRELRDKSTVYLEYWQFKVRQVIGPREMIVGIDNLDIPPLWVSDYPTDGFVDQDPVRFVGLVEVDGTKEYTTVLGAKKTVRVVRMMTLERQKELEAEKEREEQEKMIRTWNSASGSFTTEARFVEFKDGMVVLAKRDGEQIEVKPSALSRDDQKYYRDYLRSGAKAKKGSP